MKYIHLSLNPHQLQKIEKYEDITVKKELTNILREKYKEEYALSFDRFTMDIAEYYNNHPFIAFDTDGRDALIKWKTKA